MPPPEMVNNWKLLEREIITALREDGKHVAKNADGDPCAVYVNVVKLAQALSPRVLVKVTPLRATD
jgi:hypothetical protein